jgi:hypothetical protein
MLTLIGDRRGKYCRLFTRKKDFSSHKLFGKINLETSSSFLERCDFFKLNMFIARLCKQCDQI